MALIHRAEMSPTKAELLAAWVPSQPWSGGAASAPVELVGAYRFDDPAGEVGIETHLLRAADGRLLQVPLTYRGAPLHGGEAFLVGTTEHSQLGLRWVYDGCGDPVYASALAAAICTGGREAELWVEGNERREPTARVIGSGAPDTGVPPIDAVASANTTAATTVDAPGLELVVLRAVGATMTADDAETLTGTWPGTDEPTLLALARRR